MKRMVQITLTLIIAVLALAPLATADVPPMINYQGRLTDASGVPLDDTVTLTFTIYDSPTDGVGKWTEMHPAVTVTEGFFSIILGSDNPILDTVFNEATRYLGIQVRTDPELTPRTRLVSVGYSHRVSTVDGATGGTISGDVDIQSDLTVSGKVGIGTNAPTRKLDIASSVTGHQEIISVFAPSINDNSYADILLGKEANVDRSCIMRYIYGTAGNDGVMCFFNYGDQHSTQSLAVKKGGNVGIGTTSPSEKLHVIGNIRASSSLLGQSVNVSGEVVAGGDLFSTGKSYLNDTTGIGTTNFLGMLNVSGDVRVYNGTVVATDGGGWFDVLIVDDNLFSNGYLYGQGATFSGYVRLNGGGCYVGSWGACSDVRYKQNIKQIANALQKITAIRGVTFSWKRDEYPEKNFSDDTQIGFVAQELKEILPEAVFMDNDGFYAVDYSRLTPVLVEAVKEQQNSIQQLESRVERLESLVETLLAQRDGANEPKAEFGMSK
jgi:hypothetical protein